MSIKTRIEKVEQILGVNERQRTIEIDLDGRVVGLPPPLCNWEFIVIKDDEEHLRASLQGPGKIIMTESGLECKRQKVERAKAEGIM